MNAYNPYLLVMLREPGLIQDAGAFLQPRYRARDSAGVLKQFLSANGQFFLGRGNIKPRRSHFGEQACGGNGG